MRESVKGFLHSYMAMLSAIARWSNDPDFALTRIDKESVTDDHDRQARELIMQVWGTLNDLQRTVLTLNFGLDLGARKPVTAIAAEINLSVKQVTTAKNEALTRMQFYIIDREKLRQEYWFQHSPIREGYEVSQITPALACVPYTILDIDSATFNQLHSALGILCLGDLVVCEEREIFGWKHVGGKRVKKLKEELAELGLHLAWPKSEDDNPSAIERYPEKVRQILRDVAEANSRTPEQIWRQAQHGARVLGITNRSALAIMAAEQTQHNELFSFSRKR